MQRGSILKGLGLSFQYNTMVGIDLVWEQGRYFHQFLSNHWPSESYYTSIGQTALRNENYYRPCRCRGLETALHILTCRDLVVVSLRTQLDLLLNTSSFSEIVDTQPLVFASWLSAVVAEQRSRGRQWGRRQPSYVAVIRPCLGGSRCERDLVS